MIKQIDNHLEVIFKQKLPVLAQSSPLWYDQILPNVNKTSITTPTATWNSIIKFNKHSVKMILLPGTVEELHPELTEKVISYILKMIITNLVMMIDFVFCCRKSLVFFSKVTISFLFYFLSR